ncbi:MAG TPA: hypothetical protein PLH11_06835 [Gemmobacter sp.]|nr:hypothetical protein [Gemmobacter sp.]
MKNAMIAGLIVTFLSGCTDLRVGMYAFPAVDWSIQVMRQCGVAPNGGASPACAALGECVKERGQETLLGDRDDESRYIAVVRAYYRIIPREDPVAPPSAYKMSFLRARAERAGPDGMAVFSMMADIRKTCITQTGLTGRIGYD